MSEELKLCPFCGGDGEIGWHQISGGEVVYRARCADACYSIDSWCQKREEAIAAWNRRAETREGEQ